MRDVWLGCDWLLSLFRRFEAKGAPSICTQLIVWIPAGTLLERLFFFFFLQQSRATAPLALSRLLYPSLARPQSFWASCIMLFVFPGERWTSDREHWGPIQNLKRIIRSPNHLPFPAPRLETFEVAFSCVWLQKESSRRKRQRGSTFFFCCATTLFQLCLLPFSGSLSLAHFIVTVI